ncbi:MAG: DUF5698 domain-containing protein, partial [Limisphaerales bacterium]
MTAGNDLRVEAEVAIRNLQSADSTLILARIIDVSLDTIRMVSVVQGRRAFAAVLGFFQAVVFICAVAKVLLNMNQPVYALAYGLGFGTGTYLGMTIERRLAFGRKTRLF